MPGERELSAQLRKNKQTAKSGHFQQMPSCLLDEVVILQAIGVLLGNDRDIQSRRCAPELVQERACDDGGVLGDGGPLSLATWRNAC